MKALFADDLVIWHNSNSTIIGQRRIQEDLMNLERYCTLWKLKINITKTVYTIFRNSHKVAEKNLNHSISGAALKVIIKLKLLVNQEVVWNRIKKELLDTETNINKHNTGLFWGCGTLK